MNSSAIDIKKFTQLCERLAEIDLFGKAPPAPPWGNRPTVPRVAAAINSGTSELPLVYRTGYVQPLRATLPALIRRNRGQVEPFIAPIYEHALNSTVKPELGRFLAVISNLYRSFLDKTKRAKLNIKLNETLPPLAYFQNSGLDGPFTIPASDLQSDIQTAIGIVSLPATYRDDPLLFASLAHETGGHDVVHADDGLIDQLQQGIRGEFGGGPPAPGGQVSPQQLQGFLWSYWMDEAVADVYGVLNIGPQFALNLAAFFSALNAAGAKKFNQPIPQLPSLRTESGPRDPKHNDFQLDEHPTDLLRLDLAIGVIETLTGLADGAKQQYIANIRQVAIASAQGANQILLDGILPVDQHTGINLQQVKLPLADMQDAARKVGAFIATTKFAALDNHSIQDIETWDDLDEQAAQNIASKLLASEPIVNLGDDAQLLAGANAALLVNPDLYDAVTNALSDALDASFAQDPIWAPPARDSILAPHRIPRTGPKAARKAFRPAARRRRALRRRRLGKIALQGGRPIGPGF
jgi:hypothetical protein